MVHWPCCALTSCRSQLSPGTEVSGAADAASRESLRMACVGQHLCPGTPRSAWDDPAVALGATGMADTEPANRECGCVEACGTRTRACGAQTAAAAALGSGAVGSVEAKGENRPGIPCGQKTVVRRARRHLITVTVRGVLRGQPCAELLVQIHRRSRVGGCRATRGEEHRLRAPEETCDVMQRSEDLSKVF